MRSFKTKLLSTTVATAFVGVGIAVGGAVTPSAPGFAAGAATGTSGLLPTAKPKPRHLHLAACNPCAAKKCNPCAAKGCGPCNPCAG